VPTTRNAASVSVADVVGSGVADCLRPLTHSGIVFGKTSGVATLADIARTHTALNGADIDHLQRLVGEWGMLADLCFADLLLYAETREHSWVVVGQVRPATAQTLYLADWVGAIANDSEDVVLDQVRSSGAEAESDVVIEGIPNASRMRAIPVRRNGQIIAVLTREWSERVGRQLGELERTYLGMFERFAAMIAEGTFPFESTATSSTAAPRVGDGVMVLDSEARVQYASPNAVSAMHRVGITTNAIGLRLAELGFHDKPVREAFDTGKPVVDEFDQTPEIAFSVRSIPVLAQGSVTGGVLLLRDVSELRRRDRMILSRDATIQEIHHRVKNNLQTISSLLRLQARRLESAEAKEAIAESVRRIRTIALVHETLSRETGEEVSFNDIVRPLARLAEDGLQSPDRPVRFVVKGDGGRLPAIIATPLSVVLTELLQNAVDHAFGRQAGVVVVQMANDGVDLTITVVDDGDGLPDGFVLEQATGLGLSIVRTLVTTELGGTLFMRTATAADLATAGLAPETGPGTLVELKVPATSEMN
jgi:two-component system, sensor histidine kinase PdtaS